MIRKITARLARMQRDQHLRSIYARYSKYTMITEQSYVANLLVALNWSHVQGCVVECGVWRGGMSAGIADILGAEREYFLFDSFEGLPDAQDIDGPGALAFQADKTSPQYHDNCRAEIESAEQVMALSAATKYKLIKGWFSDTLPDFVPPGPIAVLRLDGDWYESTMTCLEALYDHVVPGGIIVVDDYYTWDGCTRAVHDFLSKRSLSTRILQSNGVCVLAK